MFDKESKTQNVLINFYFILFHFIAARESAFDMLTVKMNSSLI